MNSPKKLNYEVRPVKFTERKMMLAILQRVCGYFGNKYQYIGFGGLTFTDFKLFHKELHVDEMTTIEAGSFSKEKIEFNSPYSFIKIFMEGSTSALNKIDLKKKSLVWLDYDGVLDDYMFDDITLLFSKLPEGSIYVISCNKELKFSESNTEYTTEQFKEKFGSLVPFDLSNEDFSGLNNHKTIRKMLLSHIQKVLKERSGIESELNFHQLFNVIYKENRGANMFTYGGVLGGDNFNPEELSLVDFDFFNPLDIAYKIEMPNLTRKEVELINSKIHLKEKELLEMNVISENDLEKYKKSYKYMPHFYDIRV
jgi:hypothetical protein